jgi:hypothetical protein
MKEKGEIVFYPLDSAENQIEVRLGNDTVWLSLNQMADLFGRDKSVISKHLSNMFGEDELDRSSVVAKNATTGADGKTYQVDYFNLDVIISIGYRVKSKQGTQFRIWANRVLTKGYAIDTKRFQEQSRQLEDLKQTVKLLGKVVDSKALDSDEATGLLKVVTDYAYALDVLDRYDHQVLEIEATSPKELFQITYPAAMEAIKGLKDKFGGSSLFGNEKDESFRGSLAAIYQTFGGKDLYPRV